MCARGSMPCVREAACHVCARQYARHISRPHTSRPHTSRPHLSPLTACMRSCQHTETGKTPVKCLSEAASRPACCSLIRRSCPIPHRTSDKKDTAYETKNMHQETFNTRYAHTRANHDIPNEKHATKAIHTRRRHTEITCE